MKSKLLSLLLAFILASKSVISTIQVEPDGGYSGIVIKISEDVPEDECYNILQKVQVMLNDASRVLFNAMEEKVFFKEVVVVVPKFWRDSRCQNTIQTPRGALVYRETHIEIGLEDPIHRKSPFTQQSRGCSLRGDFIHFPYQFFTNWNETKSIYGNPSKLFVHEWAKLRYGIFDEFGFAGDKLYPNFFTVNGQIFPTGSSDLAIKGDWLKENQICDPSMDVDCHFLPNENNDQVTCSLGYLPFLPNVNRYCDLPQQWSVAQSLPPTKHNVLCQSQSAQKIIQNHSDLKNRPISTNTNLDVTMRVVKEPTTKYVLVMESSQSMIKQDLWKWISKAAQKFIKIDLPLNTKMAIVTFSNESITQHNLAPLSDEEARARIADSIPDKYKVQRSSDERCVKCGLETAVRSVLDGEESGAHIILITRGDSDLNLTVENEILELANYYQIRFSSLLVPNSGKPPINFYDSLSKLTQGRSFVFDLPENPTHDVSTGTYYRMIEAFFALRRLDLDSKANVPVTVHSNIVTNDVPNLKSTGNFAIDSTLGLDTLFGVIVDDPDNHNIKSVTFTDNGGQVYGPYSSLSNEFIVLNMKTINFPKDTPAPPFDDPAHLGLQWKYEVQWYEEVKEQSIENVIVVESKPRNLGTFGLVDIEMWTNSDLISDIVTPLTPLKLFVQVSRGKSPVLDARVKVKVNILDVNGSFIELDPIELFDAGNGNPDLLAGDGIYSRFLTSYPVTGRYSFTAYVDDNEAKAYTIQGGRNGRAMPQSQNFHPVCCGSEVTVPNDLRRPTGSFKRTLNEGPVIHLIQVPENMAEMPPARISDLRLNPDKTGRKLIAMWTAPGSNYDHGQISEYEIVFSEDITDLLDNSRSPPILLKVNAVTEKAGTEVLFSFTFNKYDKDYHLALYGIDEKGHKGNLSNIVLVRLPQPPSTIDPIDPTEKPDPQDTDWLMVGVVSGVVLTLILLLLVGLYLYFFLGKRRQNTLKSSGVNVDLPVNGNGSDNSSFDDTKNSSSNHLVPQISTISNAYKTLNGPPSQTSFANGLTPTYWSASQLLKEHEERKLRESKMGAIAEENQAYDYNSDNYAHYYHDYTDYNNPQLMYHPAFAGQRLSTADSTYNYQSGAVDYHPNAENFDEEMMRNNNKTSNLPKTSGNSDNSSSGTLGLANNSLQGSLISVNSGRPPSSVAKTRNITQV